MDYVTIRNAIVLALQSPLTRFFRTCLTLVGYEIVIGHHLGPNEAFLEVSVNNTRCLRGCGSDFNGPGPNLFWPRSEVCLQIEKRNIEWRLKLSDGL